MTSYQYRKSHCGDKTIWRPSYLHNGISYTGKMTSLYWIRVQKMVQVVEMLPYGREGPVDPTKVDTMAANASGVKNIYQAFMGQVWHQGNIPHAYPFFYSSPLIPFHQCRPWSFPQTQHCFRWTLRSMYVQDVIPLCLEDWSTGLLRPTITSINLRSLRLLAALPDCRYLLRWSPARKMAHI